MPGELTIDGKRINQDGDCYVIAEIGHNHQGDLDICKKMFLEAKNCGCDAAKLQKRDNRALFTAEGYARPYENRNSYGKTYGDHREFLEFGADEYAELKAYAAEIGIIFFSTAFDMPSVDFLDKLDMPAYKIASGDIKTTPLLKYVAQTGKPMVISTGAALMDDVRRAYDTIMPINPQLCIMQCTAGYPAEFEELDLGVIPTYMEEFPDAVIGYSGHDNGIAMPLAAYVLGARMVEKHFTLNHTWKGTDHAFSLEPIGMSKMVRDLRRARIAIGDGTKRFHDSEVGAGTKMGKKIVAARDLAEGTTLAAHDVTFKSPGDGLPPYEFDKVMGRVLTVALAADADVHLDMLHDPDETADATLPSSGDTQDREDVRPH